MHARLRAIIRRRARFRCEYCLFPERFAELHFQIDHVTARQHGGPTRAENLALACLRCNSHKGPNLSGIDPQSGEIVRLFNPRRDIWCEHFRWNGAKRAALSDVGQATIAVLCINRSDVVLARAALMAEGVSFAPVESL